MLRFSATILVLLSFIQPVQGQEDHWKVAYRALGEKNLSLADSAWSVYLTNPTDDLLLYYWSKRGLGNWYVGNYDSALIIYHQALAFVRSNHDVSNEANLYQRLANTHRVLGNTDSVNHYMRLILTIWENYKKKILKL